MPEKRHRSIFLDKRIIWFELGVVANFLHYILGPNSSLAEKFYSRGIFVGFRYLWDYSLGLSPIPLIYVLLVVLFVWATAKTFKAISKSKAKNKLQRSWKNRLLTIGLNLLAIGGGTVFLFYILWGFNYNRMSLEAQLDIKIAPLHLEELIIEAALATSMADSARVNIGLTDQEPFKADALPKNLEGILRKNLLRVLKSMGYPTPGRVRARRFWPGSVFMRFSISGIYIPYIGEGYTAGNLTSAERPFTLAHEMAHAYGFTDEGRVNFLAYLACETSDISSLQYSGRLAYWQYVSNELFRSSPKHYAALLTNVPEGIKADIRGIARNWNKYKGPLTKVGRKVNERYLRSQGIAEGIRSYDRLVLLVSAWRKKQPIT
jgi:hypothetical protein